MLSVIIPMYNASAYIVPCLRGLLRQTLHDLEILVVDDASTDGCYELCRETFGDDSRIRLLRQEKNGGPGSARNVGLKEARGEYVTFVDCDDAMLEDSLEILERTAREWEADVLYTGGVSISYNREYRDDLWQTPKDELIRLKLDGVDDREIRLLPEDLHSRVNGYMTDEFRWSVWGKVYRTAFLREHGIRFDNLYLAEDMMFFFQCLVKSERFVRMPGFYYIYRVEVESLSRGRATTAYLARILRSLFNVSGIMERIGREVSGFMEHPEELDRAIAFTCTHLEQTLVLDCLKVLGCEEIGNDAGIQNVFRECFGANAYYVKKLFQRAAEEIRHMAESNMDTPNINTYRYWEQIAAERGTEQVVFMAKARPD